MRYRREATAAMSAACALGAAVYGLVDTGTAPATQVGTAAVVVEGVPARVVERVSYDEDVERVGDVVIVAGRPSSPIVDRDTASIWALVDQLWPPSHRDELVQLSVIREGPYGLVGVVHAASTGGWILSMDAADLEHPDLLTETIVHELAHVSTLGPGSFRFGDGPCDGVTTDLGCARRDSVLARFTERFWPDGTAAGDLTDDFVNDYAATDVHEDLAETFTAWVFGWPVTASEGVADKIAFLEDDRELRALRDELVRSVPG